MKQLPTAEVKIRTKIKTHPDGTYTEEQSDPELMCIVDHHGNEIVCPRCGGNFEIEFNPNTLRGHYIGHRNGRKGKQYCSKKCLRIAEGS